MTTPLADLQALADEFTAVRRDIHRHPELGYQEFRTSDLVALSLEQWGYQVTRGLGGTGVVGQLRRGSASKAIGLRADMDALPIQEATGLAHSSSHAGVMHACGHDGHTAMLLAAAKHLAQKGRFNGTLNLIFQPAEEALDEPREDVAALGMFQKLRTHHRRQRQRHEARDDDGAGQRHREFKEQSPGAAWREGDGRRVERDGRRQPGRNHCAGSTPGHD